MLKGSTSQIAAAIVGLIRSAYRWHRKTAGVEKADAMLSKIIRGALQIKPDVYDSKANIIKYRKLVGEEDPKYHIARAIVGKIGVMAANSTTTRRMAKVCLTKLRLSRGGKAIRLAKHKTIGIVLSPIRKSQKRSVAKKRKQTKRTKKSK